MPRNKFIKTLNSITMKYFAAMEPGGKMGIMMGGVRRNGRAPHPGFQLGFEKNGWKDAGIYMESTKSSLASVGISGSTT